MKQKIEFMKFLRIQPRNKILIEIKYFFFNDEVWNIEFEGVPYITGYSNRENSGGWEKQYQNRKVGYASSIDFKISSCIESIMYGKQVKYI